MAFVSMKIANLLLLVWISLIVFIAQRPGSSVEAMRCVKKTLYGTNETLSCPGIFDSSKKMYCCGGDYNRYCCKLSESLKHRDMLSGTAKTVVKGALIVTLIIIAVIVGIVLCCCYGVYYMFFRSRRTRGQVLGASGGDASTMMVGGQPVHVTNNTSTGPSPYPTQAQPMYPTQSYPTQPPSYAATGQPAPYPAPYPAGPMPGYQTTGSDYPPPYPADKQLPYNPNYPQ